MYTNTVTRSEELKVTQKKVQGRKRKRNVPTNENKWLEGRTYYHSVNTHIIIFIFKKVILYI